MSIILSDAGLHRHLLPLTYTRPVGQLRPGILRISEGWYVRSGLSVGHRTESYLEAAYPLPYEASNWEVDGGLFPTNDLVRAVLDLRPGEVLVPAMRCERRPSVSRSKSCAMARPQCWNRCHGRSKRITSPANTTWRK